MAYSKEDEISDLSRGRPHLVILGAGASKAFEIEDGEKNGKHLPLMDENFAKIVGIEDILVEYKISYKGKSFEAVYSEISSDQTMKACLPHIEQRIRNYFTDLTLPEKPTLYDHLVLSLRKKDFIATFNWDPLLFQALQRNCKRAAVPHAIFLHGNVAIGYCATGNSTGQVGMKCSYSNKPYQPVPLLYPVLQKNYSETEFLRKSWQQMEIALNNAMVVTIFGYRAPDSDIDAINILKNAWGDNESRVLEQIEIIDIRDENELLSTWNGFIHSHHYDVYDNFYDSLLAKHPRRSVEAFWQEKMECEFIDDYPVPKDATFEQLDDWIKPYIEREMNIENAH